MVDVTPDVTLDIKGLSCPMPMLKIKKQLKTMNSGQVLLALGTDPGTKNDIARNRKKQEYELLGIVHEGSLFKFYIKKS